MDQARGVEPLTHFNKTPGLFLVSHQRVCKIITGFMLHFALCVSVCVSNQPFMTQNGSVKSGHFFQKIMITRSAAIFF